MLALRGTSLSAPRTTFRHFITARTTRNIMTEGRFRYIDPATYDLSASKPWGKVDADVTSFSRTDTPARVHDIRGREAEFKWVSKLQGRSS